MSASDTILASLMARSSHPPLMIPAGSRVRIHVDNGAVYEGVLRDLIQDSELGHEMVVALGTSRPDRHPKDTSRVHVSGGAVVYGDDDKYKKQYTEEESMYPKVTLVRKKSKRSTNIHIEVLENEFLTEDGQTIERQMGGEMPIWKTLPNELLIPLVRAAKAEPYLNG